MSLIVPSQFQNQGFASATMTTVSVGMTSTLILAANMNRKAAGIINNTGAMLYVSLGSTGAVGTGFNIKPDGSLVFASDNLWLGTLYGIQSATTAISIDVYEGF